MPGGARPPGALLWYSDGLVFPMVGKIRPKVSNPWKLRLLMHSNPFPSAKSAVKNGRVHRCSVSLCAADQDILGHVKRGRGYGRGFHFAAHYFQ